MTGSSKIPALSLMTTEPVKIAPDRSVAVNALLAMIMVLLTYLVTIGLAVACVYLPWEVYRHADLVIVPSLALLVGGTCVAGVILASLVPRREKRVMRGLLLERTAYPALFGLLEETAGALGEALPDEVYISGDMNASVFDRRTFPGMRRRRILTIGLPLFSTMTVSEFRAIMAHEFAHNYGGDTRLGPWIYKAERTLRGTVHNLAKIGEASSMAALRLMSLAVKATLGEYLRFFLRAVQHVSRRQEFRADELACIVAGAESFCSGLVKLEGRTLAWLFYWTSEINPLLEAGYVPPVAGGFERYIDLPDISQFLSEEIERVLSDGETDPLDSHPLLKDRLGAIRRKAFEFRVLDSGKACSLLGNADIDEVSLLKAIRADEQKEGLQLIRWDEVADKVTIPRWKALVRDNSELLTGLTAESLASVLGDLRSLASRVANPQGMLLSPDQKKYPAIGTLESALCLCLIQAGWSVRPSPGALCLVRGYEKVGPFALVNELVEGQKSGEQWRTICQEMGIEGVSLGSILEMAAAD